MAIFIELGTTGANPVTRREEFDAAKAAEIFRLMVANVTPGFDWAGATTQQRMDATLAALKELTLLRAHKQKRNEVESAIVGDVAGVTWE